MPNKKSPLYNYKSPRDYPVFNMGNKASPPFKMKYKNSAFPFKDTKKEDKFNVDDIVQEQIDYDFEDVPVDEQNVILHFEEGSIPEQRRLRKKK